MYSFESSLMQKAKAEIAQELNALIGDDLSCLKESDLTDTDLLLIDNYGAKLKILFTGAESGDLEDNDPKYCKAKLKAFDDYLSELKIPHIRRSEIDRKKERRRFDLMKYRS